MSTDKFAALRQALEPFPFLGEIRTPEEHEQAISLVDALAVNSVSTELNRSIIDILVTTIERYEEDDPELAEFNKELEEAEVFLTELEELDDGVEVLRRLMERHRLGVNDPPEIGSKSTISEILNKAEGKLLTVRHIRALATRFGVPPTLFI